MIFKDREGEKTDIIWREEKPNSDETNIPILLWRGDENNSSTVALAFGIYDKEFHRLQERENLKIMVQGTDVEERFETVLVDLTLPKDEKLARKSHGQAGSGSDYLCTYCDASRKSVSNPPYSGAKEVTLTATLLSEAARYCNLNPGRKSQAELVKHSFGVKEMPLTSTEPSQEIPDALHLDINVSHHLHTIAARIFHYGGQENPIFRYEKTELEKKAIESSEEKYYTKLREKIATLPELTQFPGNFAREFCEEDNREFVSAPLPDCPEKETWKRLMTLWRSMRIIHKSKSDPTIEQIDLFKLFATEFQEKVYSFKWVSPANQVHRLSHLAYFMQSREVRSIGAFSLEGLEHGNFATKYFENTRVWKGDSKVGNKQLFRVLRFRGSPTLKKAMKKLRATERKADKCSKCGQLGHRKNMRVCPLYNQIEADIESGDGLETDEGTTDDNDLERFSDEQATETEDSAADTQTEESEDDVEDDNTETMEEGTEDGTDENDCATS